MEHPPLASVHSIPTVHSPCLPCPVLQRHAAAPATNSRLGRSSRGSQLLKPASLRRCAECVDANLLFSPPPEPFRATLRLPNPLVPIYVGDSVVAWNRIGDVDPQFASLLSTNQLGFTLSPDTDVILQFLTSSRYEDQESGPVVVQLRWPTDGMERPHHPTIRVLWPDTSAVFVGTTDIVEHLLATRPDDPLFVLVVGQSSEFLRVMQGMSFSCVRGLVVSLIGWVPRGWVGTRAGGVRED